MQSPCPLTWFPRALDDYLLTTNRIGCTPITHEPQVHAVEFSSKLWRLRDRLPYRRTQVPKACKALANKLLSHLSWDRRAIVTVPRSEPRSINMRQRRTHHRNAWRVASLPRSGDFSGTPQAVECCLDVRPTPSGIHHLRDERALFVSARLDPAARNRPPLRHSSERRHRRAGPIKRATQQRGIGLHGPHHALGHRLHRGAGLWCVEQPRTPVLSPPERQGRRGIRRVRGVQLEPLDHVPELPLLLVARVGCQQPCRDINQSAAQHGPQQRPRRRGWRIAAGSFITLTIGAALRNISGRGGASRMVANESWMYQGRQYHQWFGHGTGPKKTEPPRSGSLFDPLSAGLRVDYASYSLVAHSPRDQRSRWEQRISGANRDSLKTAVAAWYRASALSRDAFRTRFLNPYTSDEVVDNLRSATQGMIEGRTYDDLAKAGEDLTAAAQKVGIDSWPRFINDASHRAAQVTEQASKNITKVSASEDAKPIEPPSPPSASQNTQAQSIAPEESLLYADGRSRQYCIARCSSLALPTRDYGLSFQRCLLTCTGQSSFRSGNGTSPSRGDNLDGQRCCATPRWYAYRHQGIFRWCSVLYERQPID